MIERADIHAVVAQIRAQQTQLRPEPPQALPTPTGPGLVEALKSTQEGGLQADLTQVQAGQAPSFASMLKQAINNVNDLQKEAGDLRTRYELGDPDVDIVNVMIAAQKSSVSFEAMSQVRNRLVSAYQEVMRMPI